MRANEPRPLSQFPANISYSVPFNRPFEYFVIDLETAGLNPQEDPITEAAIIRVFNKSIVGQYHSLVRSGKPQPRKIVQYTGITDEMLAGAPSVETVAQELANFIGKKPVPIFAHKASFDASFLFCWNVADYIQADCPICDSLQLAKQAFPAKGEYNLDYLAKEFSLKRFDAHRALGDAYCTAQLIEHCYNKLESERGFITGRTVQGELPGLFDNPPCPFCGSALVAKDGRTRNNGAQRYRCKLCKKRYFEDHRPETSATVKRGPTFKEAMDADEDGILRCPKCGSSQLSIKENAGHSHIFKCRDCNKTSTFWDNDSAPA
ncbi:PolC-type DNA polymerase III [Eggerthella guodeyinii]|nr:3'-5' exonuclease [Eggerthella guodeyinii]